MELGINSRQRRSEDDGAQACPLPDAGYDVNRAEQHRASHEVHRFLPKNASSLFTRPVEGDRNMVNMETVFCNPSLPNVFRVVDFPMA